MVFNQQKHQDGILELTLQPDRPGFCAGDYLLAGIEAGNCHNHKTFAINDRRYERSNRNRSMQFPISESFTTRLGA